MKKSVKSFFFSAIFTSFLLGLGQNHLKITGCIVKYEQLIAINHLICQIQPAPDAHSLNMTDNNDIDGTLWEIIGFGT